MERIESAAGFAGQIERYRRSQRLRLALGRQASPQIVPVLQRHAGARLVSLSLIHWRSERNMQPPRDSEPASRFPGVLQIKFVLLRRKPAVYRRAFRKEVPLQIVVGFAGELGENAQDVGELALIRGGIGGVGSQEL